MMTYTEATAIQKQVILGESAPTDEPQEQKDYRSSVQKDLNDAKAAGQTVAVSMDWD